MRKFIFFIILIFSFLNGKVLHPKSHVVGELLNIQGKIREYYLLDNNSYTVSGPSMAYIYVRSAIPKNKKGIHSLSIKSSLSNTSELIHRFDKKVDFSVSSSLHPMHRYTNSAKIEIEIPEGISILSLENLSNFGNPILVRVIQKRQKN